MILVSKVLIILALRVLMKQIIAKLPGATVSHDQHYETGFDKGVLQFSVEESGKK